MESPFPAAGHGETRRRTGAHPLPDGHEPGGICSFPCPVSSYTYPLPQRQNGTMRAGRSRSAVNPEGCQPMIAGFLNLLVILVGLFLIGLVLIQRGKGGGLAGAFGGVGGSSPFGSKAGDAFTRITIYVAAFW